MYRDTEEHKNSILTRLDKDFRLKYDQGQKEHGGRLWKKNTFPMAKEEVIDFISYIYNLEDQLELAISFLNAGEAGKARNVLVYGNEEGIIEPDE